MRAIVWNGAEGATECDAIAQVDDSTDALVWVAEQCGHDLAGVVVEVGDDVASLEPGDLVTIPCSAGSESCSSSLWGMTEFLDGRSWGHLVRVPLAEYNLLLVARTDA